MYEIQTRTVPEQKVLSIQRNLTVGDLRAFIDSGFSQIFACLDPSAAEASGAALMIYHGEVTEDSDGPVELCVPVTGPVEPAGEIGVRLEPAHTEAYTRITKAQVRFPEILRAYDAVSDWLEREGHKPVLSPREVYVTDFLAAADDDLACDVAFPFELHR